MATSPDRIVLTSTPRDRHNLSIIAVALSEAGRAFPTRSDCLRHALETMAAAMDQSPK